MSIVHLYVYIYWYFRRIEEMPNKHQKKVQNKNSKKSSNSSQTKEQPPQSMVASASSKMSRLFRLGKT